VLTVAVRDEVDLLGAHIAYHLSAGVDHVVVGDAGSTGAARDLVATFAESEVTMTGPAAQPREARELMRRAALARGVDWIIESDPDEFWWPRGASFNDVLDAIPSRYTTVQALVRVFLPRPTAAGSFHDRMTVRATLLDAVAEVEPQEWALRPVLRVRGGAIVSAVGGHNVPLRAWYPIELFRFPLRSSEQAESFRAYAGGAPRSMLEAAFVQGDQSAASERYADLVIDDERLRAGLAAGSLVEDVRLRDRLRALVTPAEGTLAQTPSIVDEAVYAIECAAVSEVDLAGFDQHIRELEARISSLEQQFWPRVVRRLSQIASRRGS